MSAGGADGEEKGQSSYWFSSSRLLVVVSVYGLRKLQLPLWLDNKIQGRYMNNTAFNIYILPYTLNNSLLTY